MKTPTPSTLIGEGGAITPNDSATN
jgi:hypothetical protein